ncbi:MAG: glycosyltransferase family 4 protein [Candidatus Omnitrophica bacterium]|nr:glycosyltransferase family 4 protein [Candidatus Omnitrophota bacterium]
MISSTPNPKLQTLSPKIRVAQIITRMDWGGAPDIIRIICKNLDPEIYDVILISGPSEHLTQKTVEFFGEFVNNLKIVKSLQRDIHPLLDLKAFWKLLRLFKKEKFDIVHTHTAKAGCLGRIAAKLAGIKVIVHTSHGHNFYGYFNPVFSKCLVCVERILSSLTDKIITLTMLEQRDLLRFKVAAKEKIEVAHTAVESSNINKEDLQKSVLLKKELGINNGKIIVGMVGRLELIKGVKYFIEAAIQIADKFKNVQFLLVGEGSLKQDLEQRVKQAKLEDRFVFSGWREDVIDIMLLMDMMVLASLNEAVGIVLIEAQGLGIPVIASAVGGIPEVVEDGKSGILVAPKDINGFYDAMALLIEDESKRIAMAEAAIKFERDKYDPADLCRIIARTYDMLLNSN